MPRRVVLAAWEPEEPEEPLAVERTLGHRFEVHWLHELSPDLRRELLPRVEAALFFTWPKELTPDLRRMRRLRFLQRFPAGVETLPFAEIRRHRRGVRVAGGSGSNAQAVAEHAWALVLSCAKRIPRQDAAVRRGDFHQTDLPSLELAGRTLALLGYGAIGQRLARFGRAFGMRVLALRRRPGRTPRAPVVGNLTKLPGVLPQADVLVVCLPLSRETENLLGTKELGLLKPDAIVVNVARGRIVEERAAYEFLRTHPSSYWGLDVWWHYPRQGEPFRQSLPFHELPNLVQTPHAAATVPGFRARMVEFGCRNVRAFLEGRRPKNVVDFRDYTGVN